MTKTQKKRLLRLADFIVEEVPEHGFNMGKYGERGRLSLDPNSCDTEACALGWCSVLFKRLGVETSKVGPTYKDRTGLGIGTPLFGLTYDQSTELFSAEKRDKTTKQVRRSILRFVAKLEKESNA